jgi:hypothetical protein
MAELTTKQRKAMPASQFAGGKKAGGTGSFPINDKAHIANAEARERFTGRKSKDQRSSEEGFPERKERSRDGQVPRQVTRWRTPHGNDRCFVARHD